MKTLAGVIADPPTWLPWVLLVLLVVLIAVMGLTLWWLLRRKEGGDAKDESAPPPPTAGDADPDDPRLVKHMRREVRRSLQTLAELAQNFLGVGACLFYRVDPAHGKTCSATVHGH